jgi:hypothetical protein
MPPGRPKKPEGARPVVTFRADPALLAEMRGRAPDMARALNDAMRLWLAREKRRWGKGDPLTKHLAPPTAREIAAQKEPGHERPPHPGPRDRGRRHRAAYGRPS